MTTFNMNYSLFHSSHNTRILSIRIMVIVILLVAVSGCSQAEASIVTKPSDRPNVLFIAIDDLNDWVGVMGGHPEVKTPNIDRLAGRGVLFTRAYCSAPACNPSRASLLTGLRPSTTGVYHNPHVWRAALPDAVTLPQHFMAHGYHVVGGGKIFHSDYHDPQSWHEYFHEPKQEPPPNWPLHGINNLVDRWWFNDWGPLDIPDEDMVDMKTSNWAVSELNKKHQKPFFLAAGFHRPHLPWYAPQKYFDLYPLDKISMPAVKENDLDDLPKTAIGWAAPWKHHDKIVKADHWKKAVQAYLACITFVDVCVGKLVEALDKSPYADNTIIVLWSDHGYHLGEKQHWGKFALWEKAVRAPMIMVVPGLTEPKQQCDRPVTLLNIYPTLIDLCNLSAKNELEGVSL
ncbi:MAG: sulfatase, partial [Planctomycetota bacterium]